MARIGFNFTAGGRISVTMNAGLARAMLSVHARME
jgi:hypothetical protein